MLLTAVLELGVTKTKSSFYLKESHELKAKSITEVGLTSTTGATGRITSKSLA